MVFEHITTLVQSFNIFNTGLLILVIALIFAIARGITKDSNDLIEISLLVVLFFMITIFESDYIKAGLLIIACMLTIIYGLKFLLKSKKDDD